MEVGTEISQKIRSAIKAKLMELGAYVDDELPDYIMVMVANKKNKTQMRTDLGLFLGTNTDAFTTWLHGLLGKLQTITVDSSKDKTVKSKGGKERKKDREGKGSKADSTKKGEKEKKKSRKRKSSHGDEEEVSKAKTKVVGSKDSVSAQDPESSENQIQSNEVTVDERPPDKVLHVAETDIDKANPVSKAKETPVQEEFEDVRQLLVAVAPGDDLAKELDAVEEEVLSSQSASKKSKITAQVAVVPQELSHNVSATSLASSVQDSKTKRKVPSSVVATVSRDNDDEEYDPFNPAVGSVASVVKVTSRKSNFPPSMQANRALLVKAMSEAEKSISVKRKVAVTRPINREPSPVEYSPKRKRCAGGEPRASPPPYIPSRKTGPNTATVAGTRKRSSLSKDDVRHSIRRDDLRSLVSSSARREEQLRASGATSSSKNASSSAASAKPPHGSSVAPDVSRARGGSIVDRVGRGRQVRGEGTSGGIKNLQITARVGPMRAFPSSDDASDTSQGKRTSLSQSPESDGSLRVTVVSGEVRKSQANTDSRLGKAIERKPEVRGQASVGRAVSTGRDAREDIQAARQGKTATPKPSGRVISQLARDVVQKQCRAAVVSVNSTRPRAMATSDSRVVQCESESPSQDTDERVGEETPSDSEDLNQGSIKYSPDRSPSIPHVVVDEDKMTAPSTVEEKAKSETEDVEDLSHMLEDEDLDAELLLPKEEKDEFTLDLDDEDLSHVVDDVMDEPEEETESSKSGIRFIVTLDGVDEAQFEESPPAKPTSPMAAPAQPTLAPQPLPVATLSPNTVARPPQPQAQALAPPMIPSASLAARPRPPKIQPFSISLRDSDDEHEEKVVTYVQAGDITALGSVAAARQAGEELSALQRARMQERCRFWPACMAGTDCEYHHPTTHCKTFPNCKFGDKCLFIHPNCRFDSKCVRPDCPFTHTSRRRLSQAVSSSMPPPRHYPVPRYPSAPQPQQATMCHFFPNCLNASCTFAHPKPCMYGAACTNSACMFYHPVSVPLPDKHKLKWQAQIPGITKGSKLVTATVSPTITSTTTTTL